MNKRASINEYYAKLFIAAFLPVIMYFFIILEGVKIGIEQADIHTVALIFSLIYAAVLVIFWLKKDIDIVSFFLIAATAAALIYIRVCMLYNQSSDYTGFLSKWLAEMRLLTGTEALVTDIGDYNMPYLYLLLLISKLNLNDLILIKAFSCIFDIVCAFFVMKIVSLKPYKTHWQMLAFIFTLSIPTVILNGSYWGQCDVVYTSLCIASLYFALQQKGRLSVILFACAFTFKLQAIFILPALIVCLLLKKIKLRHLLWFPVVFITALLPALFAGRNFFDCVGIYFDQAAQYKKLVMNAPSFYQFFGDVSFESFNMFGIMLAGTLVLIFVYIMYIYKDRIKQTELVYIFFISALMLPYFLPRMHDRYFFLADVLSLVLFFYDHKKWYVPIVTIFCSFVTYANFVMSGLIIIDQKYTAFALLLILCVTMRELLLRLTAIDKDKVISLSKNTYSKSRHK